jgi:ABC-type amino acid transport substrate-binding protein
LYSVSNVLFSQAGTPFDYTDQKSIKKKNVAFVIGNNIQEIDDLLDRKFIKARPCVSLDEAFRLLQRGQVDLVACSSLSAYHVFMNNEKIKQEQFYLVNQPIGKTSLHLAISNKNPFAFDIIANFNLIFEDLKTSGVITKIIDEHLDEFQKKP